MRFVCKKNNELTNEELEVLYDVYSQSIKEISIDEDDYSHVRTLNYKNTWINDIKNNNRLICAEYYDGSTLVGYILVSLNDEYNYIIDFQITRNYQGDGVTFKEMIKLLLPFTNTNKKYVGKILTYNSHARNSFKSIGALSKNGMYEVTYSKLVEYLYKDLVFDDKNH